MDRGEHRQCFHRDRESQRGALRETKKFQNVRAGGTLLEKVHRIQDAGIEVWCGMIMGFDHDDATIFDSQLKFISEARIIQVMAGMLFAIPKTPLYDRLAAEGRLDLADEPGCGTNVIPLQLDRMQLRWLPARLERVECAESLL